MRGPLIVKFSSKITDYLNLIGSIPLCCINNYLENEDINNLITNILIFKIIVVFTDGQL